MRNIQILAEEARLLGISKNSRENINAVFSFGETEGMPVYRGHEMVVCYNSGFANKQTATTHKYSLLSIDPYAKIL